MAGVLMLLTLLLASSGIRCHSQLCPPSCSCPRTSVLDCASAGLSALPQMGHAVVHLDVSHNGVKRATVPRGTFPQLRSLRLSNNSLERLSLCNHRRVRGGGCASWAPNLQLLSAERNQLQRLPSGFSGLESLEVLQLSFNKISIIQRGDLDNLRGLRELYLQHNLISTVQQDAFKHLQQLKVLNLSFNKLTSIHPSTYFSLRAIGADVGLDGNRWHCDCNMRSIKRWMALDSSRGWQARNLICAAPPDLAGAELLQLEDQDLNCLSTENGPQLHRDVTVSRGSQVQLSCTTKDAFWWTPSGSSSVNQTGSGLLVSDVSERNAGLYVCFSKDRQVVAVFHLEIRESNRKARSVPEGTGGVRSQNVTQSDFILAVCLSVLITFLIAFILGVLLRPCIDKLWKRITAKKKPETVSSMEERQYDNEAYSEGEDLEEVMPHRERRVTFSTVDFGEENMKYYDMEQKQIGGGVVVEAEMVADDNSQSEQSLEASISQDTKVISAQERETKVDTIRRNMSDSSLSGTDQIKVDGVQKNSADLPQISPKQTAEFSSEPFADWMPHAKDGLLAAEPEDGEEQFDFSDSVPSTSPRTSSPIGSLNYTRQIMPRLNRKPSSGSSSYMSDNEPSHYTVNPDSEEEAEVGRSDAKTKLTQMLANVKPEKLTEIPLDQDSELWWPACDLDHFKSVQRRMDIKVCDGGSQTANLRAVPRPIHSQVLKSVQSTKLDLSIGTDSKTGSVKVENSSNLSPNYDREIQWPFIDLEDSFQVKRRLDVRAPALTSVSQTSSDSEDEAIYYVQKQKPESIKVINDAIEASPTLVYDPQSPWPAFGDSFRIEQSLHVKPISPSLYASCSSDSEDERIYNTQKQRQETSRLTQYPTKTSPQPSPDSQRSWPSIDLEDSFRIKKRLDVKALSSTQDYLSDSEVEPICDTQEQDQEISSLTQYPTKISPQLIHDSQRSWPSIDLEDSFRIKKYLDIKAPMLDLSSSNDSEDETYAQNQSQETSSLTQYPTKTLPQPSHDSQTPWPSIDLEDSFQIKKRLDVKARSSTPDYSSDSEVEPMYDAQEEDQELSSLTQCPTKMSPQLSHDSQTSWPSIDLEVSFKIKRSLDIKALSSNPDYSSDSDVESMYNTQEQELEITDITTHPMKSPPTQSYDTQTTWPTIVLEDYFRIKRRLDIKVPALNSSSSSDSEDERIYYTQKQRQETSSATQYPTKTSSQLSNDSQTSWPSIDLEDSFRIRKRLDIKALSSTPDYSSDSEVEPMYDTHVREQQTTNLTTYPMKSPPTQSYDTQTTWPAIVLEDSFRTKRRLDIKTPALNSSFSSDSEDERIYYTQKQRQETSSLTHYPTKTSPQLSHDSQTSWPSIHLEDSFRIKKRLDVRALSSTPDYSSDSEIEPMYNTQEQDQEISSLTQYPPKMSPQLVSHDSQTSWPSIDLEDSFRIKKRLDVKALSSTTDYSSDSEVEPMYDTHVQEQETTNITTSPLKSPPSQSYATQTWPAIVLKDSFRIKRRLDIKAPTLNSSFSSDSEDERIYYTQKQSQETSRLTQYPTKTSPQPSHDPQRSWPSNNLEDSFRIKKRLDVKAPSSTPVYSSDSEVEPMYDKQEQEISSLTQYPTKTSPQLIYDSQTSWPSIDLKVSFRIKKRLDIKAPSSTSDFSSDSEVEPMYDTREQDQEPIKSLPTPSYDTQTTWPTIVLENYFRIKRRLDIEVKPLIPDSSSGNITDPATGTWSSVDLDRSTRLRRRMDIRAPSSQPQLTSDSEDENTEAKSSLKLTENKVDRSPVITIPHRPKRDPDIKLEKYVSAPETTRDETSNPTPEINTELQSRWANMHLGVSRFRKRLEITSRTSPESPRIKSPTKAAKGKPSVHDNTVKPAVDPTSEVKSSLPGVPLLRRYLDVKAPATLQHLDLSTSSANEVESADYPQWKRTKDQRDPSSYDSRYQFPSVSLGKQNLPLSTKTLPNSASGDKTPNTRDTSGMSMGTKNHSSSSNPSYPLPYSSRPENSHVPVTTTQNPGSVDETAPTRDPSGVNRMTSQLATSNSTIYQIPSLSPRPFKKPSEGPSAEIRWTGLKTRLSDLSKRPNADLPSPPEDLQIPQAGSFTQVSASTTATRSPNLSVSFNPQPWKNTSQQRTGRGLNALKDMSTKRKTWETEEENVDYFPPSGTTGDLNQARSEDISFGSESTSEDVLYEIPQYRTHASLIPPPVSTTPLPEKEVELTWSSKSSYIPSISQV